MKRKFLVIICHSCGTQYAHNHLGTQKTKYVGDRCGACLGRSHTQYGKWSYCGAKLKAEYIRELELVDGLYKVKKKKGGQDEKF